MRRFIYCVRDAVVPSIEFTQHHFVPLLRCHGKIHSNQFSTVNWMHLQMRMQCVHTGMHAVSSERHQLWLCLGERQFGIGQRANIREFQRNHWESSNESTGIATYKPQWSSNRWIVWSRYLSHKIKSVVNLTPFHCTVYMTNLNLFILAPQMIAHKWAYEKKIYWVMQRKRKERRKNENSYFASTVTA